LPSGQVGVLEDSCLFHIQVVVLIKHIAAPCKDTGVVYVVLVEKISNPLVKICEHLFGLMICVSGLQGVGKSSAAMMLTEQLKAVARTTNDEYALHHVLMFKFPKDGDWAEAIWKASPYASDLFKKADQWQLEHDRKFRRYNVRRILQPLQTVLIDLGDYARRDRRLMNRDLDSIEKLWSIMLELGRPAANLVIFMQKELCKGHTFLGKFEFRELKPFSPTELIGAYRKRFEDLLPFEEAALLELAYMARGIFRRFKKYIHKCVEAYQPDASELISVDFVRKIITVDEISADMELQLSDLFSKPEHRMIAIRAVEAARLHPDLNQSELAQLLEVDDMTLSRILSKLELNGYIQRKQGEHGEKKLKLLLAATGPDIASALRTMKKRKRHG
jgi:DNA-binding MarR family transcriptional regulator/thymidylate kinase